MTSRRRDVTASLLLCLLSATPALAATVHVATTGSGSTCSQSSPCALAEGTRRLASGDTLQVHGGTYTLDQAYGCYGGSSLCPANGSLIQAAPGETVTFRPGARMPYIINLNSEARAVSGITFDGIGCDAQELYASVCYSVGFGASIAHGASHITIKNAEVQRTGGDGIGIGCGSNHVTVQQMFLHHIGHHPTGTLYGHGIYSAGDDTRLVHNRLEDIANFGIQVYDSQGSCAHRLQRPYIEGNRIHRVGQKSQASNGIVVNFVDPTTTVDILNNLITDTVSSACVGIGYSRGGRYRVYNNTLHRCGGAGVALDGSSTYTALLTNNIVWQSGRNGFIDHGRPEAPRYTLQTNLTGDPSFVDAAGGIIMWDPPVWRGARG